MGYYLSKMKLSKKRNWNITLKAIFIPVLIHTFYNYYLIYITNIFKRLLDANKAIIVTYSLLVLILGCLFLIVHYILYKSSIEDKKIKVTK